jgi:uncharacterized protein
MKYRTPLTAPFMAAMLLATPALAQTERPAMISVSGEATVSVPPDMAEVDGGFTSEAKPRVTPRMPATQRWARCCWR